MLRKKDFEKQWSLWTSASIFFRSISTWALRFFIFLFVSIENMDRDHNTKLIHRCFVDGDFLLLRKSFGIFFCWFVVCPAFIIMMMATFSLSCYIFFDIECLYVMHTISCDSWVWFSKWKRNKNGTQRAKNDWEVPHSHIVRIFVCVCLCIVYVCACVLNIVIRRQTIMFCCIVFW